MIGSNRIRYIDEGFLREMGGDRAKGSVYFGEREGQKDEIRVIDERN